MPAATYDLKQFEKNKASLFTDVESLPSLACRRRCVPAAHGGARTARPLRRAPSRRARHRDGSGRALLPEVHAAVAEGLIH